MSRKSPPPELVAWILEQVREQGVELEALSCCGEGEPTVRVVCVPASLRQSLEGMVGSTRNQVVMVRVDEETAEKLDAWVSTGAVRSRSEAAALFIREGLHVRASELEGLRDALEAVDRAKQQLHERVRKVLKSPPTGEPDTPDEEG